MAVDQVSILSERRVDALHRAVIEAPIDVKAAMAELARLEEERDAAAKRMDNLLRELGYAR